MLNVYVSNKCFIINVLQVTNKCFPNQDQDFKFTKSLYDKIIWEIISRNVFKHNYKVALYKMIEHSLNKILLPTYI
jgi:hypothetical protein